MLALILGALSGFTSKRPPLVGYELSEKIGEGAMGVLYRAKQLGLDREVAVKVCKRDDRRAATRFRREARAAAELVHPNTIRVFDSGTTRDGAPYYAMELVRGSDLERHVEQNGALSPQQVIDVVCQLADALVEVHARGLVHQDIKPANVVLRDSGEAVLIDFGLVRDGEREDDGTYCGTPAFSAPEQITDPDSIGPHTDIYALGALAFYLLSGRAVFGGDSVADVCARHIHDQAPPASAVSEFDVPAELDAAIADCLSKNPAKRPSARSLRHRLMGYARGR